MSNINPFKRISDIEKGIVEFKKVDIGVAIVATFFYIFEILIASLFIIKSDEASLKIFIFNSITTLALFVITIIFFYGWYTIVTKEEDICERISLKITIKNIFYLTIVVLGVRIISNDLMVFILIPFSDVLMPKNMSGVVDKPLQTSLLIYGLITGPMMEEFVFRGVILGGLLKKYSIRKSIVISSLLFGIMHLNGIQFINAFFLGSFIGYIYVKTKSIYLSIYFHMLFNMSAYIFTYLPEIHNLLVTILFAIIGFIFIIYGIKKLNNFEIINLKTS